MNNPKHFVIFSHGFGVKKDDRGLLTGVSAALPNIKTILFDYNEVNETENTLTVRPLAEQTKILEKVLEETRNNNPDTIMDMICHSQGSMVAAMLRPKGIRKVIFLAPPFSRSTQKTVDAFKDRPGSELNIFGISRLARQDGSVTIVPAEFWQDKTPDEVTQLYNDFSKETELIIVRAKQDEILHHEEIVGLSKDIKVVDLEGGHNFDGEYRDGLIKVVKNLIM